MEFQKKLNGKMNSDVSEFELPSGDYPYAMNIRIGSSVGNNVGVVTNVKSNQEIAIPSELQYLFDTTPMATFIYYLHEHVGPYVGVNMVVKRNGQDFNQYTNMVAPATVMMRDGDSFYIGGYPDSGDLGAGSSAYVFVVTIIKDGVMVFRKTRRAIDLIASDYAGTAQGSSTYNITVESFTVDPMLSDVFIADSYSTPPPVKIKVVHTTVAEDVKKLFWYTYRSDGRDFILEFDVQSETISKILVNLVDTGGIDITKFSLIYRINSSNLIDGKLLKWTDENTGPKSLNIDKAKSGSYGIITDENISAIKAPSLIPPIPTFFDDASKTVNYMKKNLFQFSSLFIYDDGERSVYSTDSIRATPDSEASPGVNVNPKNNVGISIEFDCGSSEVKMIELIARSGNGDWFIIATLDRSVITALNIDGTEVDGNYSKITNTYKYKFFNDGNYINVDIAERGLLFDNMPQKAKTQEYVSNSMVYANITEGYDPVNVIGVVYPEFVTGVIPCDPVGISIKSWKTNSSYEFGLVYYDKYGRSGSVNTADTLKVNTDQFAANAFCKVPVMSWSISHQPPSWAVRYQWVRTERLTHQNFLYWRVRTATLVTQAADSYYDLVIDNLESFNRINKSSILNYAYASGDRVTVHRRDATTFSTGYDTDIVEFAVYTPPTPPSTVELPLYRLRIKAKTGVTLAAGALIEIYTPTKRNTVGDSTNIFYEFGESYEILDPGKSTAAHSKTDGTFKEGDVYYRYRAIPTEAPSDDSTHVYTSVNEIIEDPNFSDSYVSNFSSNGRPNIVDKNFKQIHLPTSIRFSQPYIPNTDVNGLNRLYQLSIEEYDKTHGPIQIVAVRDNYLICFQYLKTGAIPVYSTIVEDQTGANQVLLSEKLLNRIRYYFGDFGIGDHPEALSRNEGYFYFPDANRGIWARLAGDGINAISKQAYMDSFFRSKLTEYAKGNQRINSTFDKKYGECIISFESEDVNIYDESSTNSEWYTTDLADNIDRNSLIIVSQPDVGASVDNLDFGVVNFIPNGSYVGQSKFVYNFADKLGVRLPNVNMCVNVTAPSTRPTKWVGIDPHCYSVSGFRYKFYNKRQLFYDDTADATPEPVLNSGVPIISVNYDPVNPSVSTSNPLYVPHVLDNCFCYGDCGASFVTVMNKYSKPVIVNETYSVINPVSKTIEGVTYFSLRWSGGNPGETLRVYVYKCPVLPGSGDWLPLTQTYPLYVVAPYGSIIFITYEGGPLPPAC